MSGESSFDLVVGTMGRASVLTRFLKSVKVQEQPHLRVIIVDQNPDDRVAEVIAPFARDLSILRLQSPAGLSRARNLGLRHVTADIVAFPDDDCWYPPDLLRSVAAELDRHPDWDGISVRARDGEGRVSSMRWDGEAGPIDRYNVWRRAISFSFFLRSHVVASVGQFDENLGVGAGTPWRSSEESEYLLRALDAGFSLQFEPSLFVYHESPKPAFDREASRDAYLRGLGHGEVLHRRGYPRWFVAWRVTQLAAGATALLALGRAAEARYYFAMAFGRARGWLSARRRRDSAAGARD